MCVYEQCIPTADAPKAVAAGAMLVAAAGECGTVIYLSLTRLLQQPQRNNVNRVLSLLWHNQRPPSRKRPKSSPLAPSPPLPLRSSLRLLRPRSLHRPCKRLLSPLPPPRRQQRRLPRQPPRLPIRYPAETSSDLPRPLTGPLGADVARFHRQRRHFVTRCAVCH